MDAPRSGEAHTAAEWEAIRRPFLELYMTAGLTLRETAAVIAARHGFRANVRQYKRRIQLWGAQKSKVTTAAVPAVAALPTPTSTPSPATLPGSDGNEPESAEGHRAAAPARALPSPFDLTLVEVPRSRGQLKSLDLAVAAISSSFEHARGIMLAAQALADARDKGKERIKAVPWKLETAGWALGQFYLRAQTLSAMMGEPNVPGGFAHRARDLRKLNGEIQDFISRVIDEVDPSPLNVTCLLQVCCKFWREDQMPVLRILLQYISQRAALKSPTHPLRLICNAFLEVLDHVPALAAFSARRALETSTSLLAPGHAQTLSAYRGLHAALFDSRNYPAAREVAIQCFNAEYECGRNDPNSTDMWRIEALLRLVRCEVMMMDLDAAEQHLDELAAFIEANNITAANSAWSVPFFSLDFRGEVLRLRGDPLGLGILEEAATMARTNGHLFNRYILIYAERHLQHAKDPANRWSPWPLLP